MKVTFAILAVVLAVSTGSELSREAMFEAEATWPDGQEILPAKAKTSMEPVAGKTSTSPLKTSAAAPLLGSKLRSLSRSKASLIKTKATKKCSKEESDTAKSPIKREKITETEEEETDSDITPGPDFSVEVDQWGREIGSATTQEEEDDDFESDSSDDEEWKKHIVESDVFDEEDPRDPSDVTPGPIHVNLGSGMQFMV